jgi:mono/diheme cytochrome c family protein
MLYWKRWIVPALLLSFLLSFPVQAKPFTKKIRALLVYVQSDNSDFFKAAKMTGKLGLAVKPALPVLKTYLGFSKRVVKVKAFWSLMAVDKRLRKEVVALLFQALTEPDKANFTNSFLRRGFKKYVQDSLPYLMPGLKHPHPNVRRTVMVMLHKAYPRVFRHKRRIRYVAVYLLRGLKDKDRLVRRDALLCMMDRPSLVSRRLRPFVKAYLMDANDKLLRDKMKRFLESNGRLRGRLRGLAWRNRGVKKAKLKEMAYWASASRRRWKLLKKAYLSQESLEAGKKVYNKHCAMCHKSDGVGMIGPNLTDLYSVHGVTLKALYKVITKGGRKGKGMISWKSKLSEQERIDVAAYVASLKKNPKPGMKPAKDERKQRKPRYLKRNFK